MSDHPSLKNSVALLNGFGKHRAELLNKEFGIESLYDLLFHFPIRYVDKSRFYSISEIRSDQTFVLVKGVLFDLRTVGEGRTKRLVGELKDATGSLDLVWFKPPQFLLKTLKNGQVYQVFGKASRFGDRYSIAHPEISKLSNPSEVKGLGIEPIYSSTEKLQKAGLSQRIIKEGLRKMVTAVDFGLAENLPQTLIKKLQLPQKTEAIRTVHFPQNLNQVDLALNRFKFEELFFLQLRLLYKKLIGQKKIKGRRFEHVGDLFLTFYKHHLPFELTNAQKRVIKEIRNDLGSGVQMNRLLQGDVGSGKTMVALLSGLIAIGNNSQAAIIAPTEILAQQHYNDLVSLLSSLPVNVALLTGSTSKKDRKVIFEDLLSGELHLIIGTHALIEDNVSFKDLGVAIIDEQHRFGVAQRSKLWKKAKVPPHILVMTATPIPRTLAMSHYGDLDVSLIDELPPGRKPILTQHRTDSARLKVFQFMKSEIAKGRQIYIVYPLIQESETLDYKDLMDGYESIQREFPLPKYQISIVHGGMNSDAKAFEMRRFEKGETQIMVATTVIEVGVNVPNASVMVIESAERFGLSQLHQLRGRVGRGAEKSYCILMSGSKISEDARTRLEAMVSTQNGFELSEIDLQLRGPGDLMGTQQSGTLQLKVSDIVKDSEILYRAREAAEWILARDPELTLAEHQGIRTTLNRLLKGNLLWSYIS
ncbi:MAG: ATP-dependent DNA helicase RecG [Flavobacteriaceae bacterium]